MNSGWLSVHLYFAEKCGWKTTPKIVFDRKSITWGQTNVRLPDIYFPLLSFFNPVCRRPFPTFPQKSPRRPVELHSIPRKGFISTSNPRIIQKGRGMKNQSAKSSPTPKKGVEVCRGEEIGLCWKGDVNIYAQCWWRVNRQRPLLIEHRRSPSTESDNAFSLLFHPIVKLLSSTAAGAHYLDVKLPERLLSR